MIGKVTKFAATCFSSTSLKTKRTESTYERSAADD